MTQDVVDKLATYFTGPAVPHNSICLQLGPPHDTIARLFFEIRLALGITGYDDKAKAVKAIAERLC